MDSFALVIFGITGNLAQIKLIPALYDMEEKDLLPKDAIIVGIARRNMTNNDLQKYVHEALHLENVHHQHSIKEEVFKKLCKRFKYISGEIQSPSVYEKLENEIKHENRIYYLATYPELYHFIFENLQKLKMNLQNNGLPRTSTVRGWVRLMIEKPIGHDLTSSKQLNQLVSKYFSEDQIYRLDHYLGKETLQNILTFRFANDIFEPLINKDYIDHIQITASEDFGIGRRGGYYDQVGALKDVGQNHQLQMLSFATMDAPSAFTNEAVTAERIKILKSLKPLPEKVILGQYKGYTEEENVASDSKTDTFYALKTYIDSERFKDVPIYVRAGKKLKKYVTEISIVFKNPVNKLFKSIDTEDESNILVYRIQPNEGIVLKILTKVPGSKQKLQPEYMQYCYRIDPHSHYVPDPYESLLSDAIKGDQTFFNDAKEIEAQWAFIDPLAKVRAKPHIYKVGTWGPKEADELLEADGRVWLEPSMEFCRI
ncbi:MAG: glucose-6-phosphate dehydrogenase [Patescibacteria group bacterium]